MQILSNVISNLFFQDKMRSLSNRSPPDPPPPELCCMSGCANCVWIEYAKELKKYSKAGESDLLIDEALSKIEDHSFRMFIKMEIDGILSQTKNGDD